MELFCSDTSYDPASVCEVLRIPWVLADYSEGGGIWEIRAKTVRLAAKLECKIEGTSYYKIVEQALQDDDLRVHATAVAVIPVLAQRSSAARVQQFCQDLL